MTVAALVNWNDIVKVFDAVQRWFEPVACSFTASITATASFQFTSAATITEAITSTLAATEWLRGR